MQIIYTFIEMSHHYYRMLHHKLQSSSKLCYDMAHTVHSRNRFECSSHLLAQLEI